MSNLFMVYTPFQLMVAQEIINQEKLENNILLKGYVGSNFHFLQIYDYMKIEEIWQTEYLIPNISYCFDVDLYHPLKSISRIRKHYKQIEAIIQRNNVKTLYLGNINNNSIRVLAKVFAKNNISVIFFEEGTAHYTYIQSCLLSHKPKIAKLYRYVFDRLCYMPVFKQSIGEWQFERPLQFSEIPITKRYSILPLFHESFDSVLKCNWFISEKAKNFVKQEVAMLQSENKVLFLEQPVYEIVQDSMGCFLKIISSVLDSLSKDTEVVIKYHPRETKEVKEEIEGIIKSKKIKYSVIGSNINLPVELYLQIISFRTIYNFYSSSSLYNGTLFNETPFHYLIKDFYTLCKTNNLYQSDQLTHLMDLCPMH